MRTKQNKSTDLELLRVSGYISKEEYINAILSSFKKANEGKSQHFIVVTHVCWLDFINNFLELSATNGWIYQPELTTVAYQLMTMTFRKKEEYYVERF